MKVPLMWLREYCSPDLDTDAIEERLTMTGTKVETIVRHGAPSTESFVVGRVLSVEPHPNADRLSVCSVDLGTGEPAGIVCGAPNVAAGQTVAVALPGAVMPGGVEINDAKLRGVASSGMILAADELQIDSDHSGIMVLDELILDAELAAGTPLADVLSVGTDVLELEITPNRPDCLGVYGVARELHAATGAPLAPEPWCGDLDSHPAVAGELTAGGWGSIAVECPDLCPRFTARAFENVTIGPSPLWLKARLSAAGQRPINNVVDITNYVMLLTGQPLHAFDLDRVAGAQLTVRRAREGERVATLDGQVRTLDSEMVVIEDADGPTSIAGIMGGERSEVQADTKRVLMEVANWSGPNIHRTSWVLGLRSEASGRFEKGLAPEQCMHAQVVATRLMVELCGATPLPGTIDVRAEPAPGGWEPKSPILLRERRVASILGMPVARARQAEILQALDFGVSEADAAGEPALEVTVPPVRREDVTREADLIEEVARINGLGELPPTLPARRGAYGALSPVQRLRRRAVDALVGRGLYEAVGWTFTAPGLLDRLRLHPDDPRRRAPVLENPLSEDQSLLRTTLLGSLLDVARHNAARGMADLRLFEVGRIFVRADGETGVDEHGALAVLLAGRLAPPTWGAVEPGHADFFAAKGLLEALGQALRVELECRSTDRRSKGSSPIGDRRDLQSASQQPFLHPGRAAAVFCDGQELGWIGELHPLVAREWDLEGAAVMELDFDRLLALSAAREHGYRDVISYPSVRQDLAVVLADEIPAARAIELVRAAGGDLLDSVEVFDVYSGEQVGEGRRSLALSLDFRAPDRTLTDADVVPLRERIVQALEELGGELRV
ncbi:MAG TPA: phenylalanine--tRNA ligase subunit beta [Solirubrobacteraceae bacterium]|jgi:phenylalanyl-tRNA synthetase beta chain|nr:phenylalanine--tRNA ligase subunit beta [Solirubrobacteraceae bacterium]